MGTDRTIRVRKQADARKADGYLGEKASADRPQTKRPPRLAGVVTQPLGYRLDPPGQVCSGGRSPILIRSAPPMVVSGSEPHRLAGSAGRATGRVTAGAG